MIISREYKIYQEDEIKTGRAQSLYEKACRFSGRILKIDPDKNTKKMFQEAIDFAHIKTTPRGVISFTILFLILVSIPIFLFILLNLFGILSMGMGYGILALLIALPLTLYLYIYPLRIKKIYETDVGSEIVIAILYMSLYMRNTPNLEGAVKFASRNLAGPLALELRKLMWDVEVGNYTSIQYALVDYTKKWSKNKDFVESIEILISSLKQVGERRKVLLDEAINVILEGNRENAKHFNQDLKMPVMIVHALGIILPVMGLVMFPIIAVFLGIGANVLFVGYDVLLPLILYFVINNILETRPSTFSRIDIKENPDLPPTGKFFIKNKNAVPAWPFGLLVGFVITFTGLMMYVLSDSENIISAVVILGGITMGFAVFMILDSFQKIKIRDKTKEIEREFSESLFQLGNQISSGTPIELSLQHSMRRIENLKIKDLFYRAIKNMKSLGMTFEESFFHRKYGAINYYPSRLIKSIMRMVVESTKKGVNVASVAMISVSKYLKGIHNTQEEVTEELNDTVNSLKFQAFFLSPMISGVIITMAIIILRILSQLSSQLTGSNMSIPFLTSFSETTITPFQFILIVGIYLIEVSFILSMFINGIENGHDPIGRNNLNGYVLVIGYIVFVICMFVTLGIFSPLVGSVVS